jgi:hypothetical protein
MLSSYLSTAFSIYQDGVSQEIFSTIPYHMHSTFHYLNSNKWPAFITTFLVIYHKLPTLAYTLHPPQIQIFSKELSSQMFVM